MTDSTTNAITPEQKRRARWRRNKEAQRNRTKLAATNEVTINEDLAKRVWAERDRRLRNFPWSLSHLPGRRFYPRRMRESSYPLVCDVWAVEILLQDGQDDKRISDGKIAKWLIANGRSPDVKATSLRTLVGRARIVVRHLEDSPARGGHGPFWPKFPEPVAEMGSGLMQHVNIVLPNFGIE